MAWAESLRGMKASLVPKRDNPIELYTSSLPSVPPRRMLVEQPEYSSETDGPGRISTILEVSSCSASYTGSSEKWVQASLSVFSTGQSGRNHKSLQMPKPSLQMPKPSLQMPR